jgi:hypothetical protein
MSIRTPQRVCLFCGRTLRLSNEHIVPQWLMDHLCIRDATITPTVTETASARIVNLRRHPVRAFVADHRHFFARVMVRRMRLVCLDPKSRVREAVKDGVRHVLPARSRRQVLKSICHGL